MALDDKQPKPQPETKPVWVCDCGAKNFAHRGSCALCGSAKPGK